VRSMANWDCKDESKSAMAMESLRHPEGDLGGTGSDEWPTTSAQVEGPDGTESHNDEWLTTSAQLRVCEGQQA
jgi:hypothetical protein